MKNTSRKIAQDWIDKWNSPEPTIGADDFDLDFDIPRNNPELCLEAIIEILKVIPADPANKHFQVLAAGPLEDFLIEHGEAFIDEVEQVAGENSAFKLLLQGAWYYRVNPKVVQRLAKFGVRQDW